LDKTENNPNPNPDPNPNTTYTDEGIPLRNETGELEFFLRAVTEKGLIKKAPSKDLISFEGEMNSEIISHTHGCGDKTLRSENLFELNSMKEVYLVDLLCYHKP
jgi:hypothetical protein